MKKYAITDIHGCLQSFDALLDKIALSTADELYLLGDYIDRGPDSKGVLDRIFDLQSRGYKLQCLRGNHDDALPIAAKNRDFFFSWFDGWGGQQTLESFGVHNAFAVPIKYMDFCKNLQYVLEMDGYILVHAGLDFKRYNPLLPDAEMMYARNWYNNIDYDWLGDRIIVHGHTPITVSETESHLKHLDSQRYIDIDTGCFVTHHSGKGHLCALDLTNRTLFFQKCLDDTSGYWSGR